MSALPAECFERTYDPRFCVGKVRHLPGAEIVFQAACAAAPARILSGQQATGSG